MLDVPGVYALPLPLLMLHAVGSMLGVFAACSLLDWLRLRFVEPRYMAWYDANEEKIARAFSLVARVPGAFSAGLKPVWLRHRFEILARKTKE